MLLQLVFLVSLASVDVLAVCPYDDTTLIDWDTAEAWDGEANIPKLNEKAVIKTGKKVRLNVSPPNLKGIVIEPDAVLTWGNFDDLVLTTDYIHIKGTFNIGDESCPFTEKAKIRLTGKSDSSNILDKLGRKVIGVDEGGTIELHGAVKKSWTKLIQTMPVGLETCGVIYNYQESKEKSESTRGLYVMAFNLDGSIFDFGIFRTYDANDDTAEDRFKYFIESIPTDKVLVVAVNGNLGLDIVPSRDWEKVYTAMETIGGLTSTLLRKVEDRDAYAFIMRTGDSSTAKEQYLINLNDDSTVSTDRIMYYDDVNLLQYSVVCNIHPVKNQELDILVLSREIAYPKLKLNDDVTSWNAGDSIVVASTDYDWKQVEEFTLVECTDCEENEVRVDHPFEYMHYGEITYGVDERAEVGLLTRSILIEGVVEDECYVNDEEDQYLCDIFNKDMHGGHLKIIKGFSAAHIENVELYHMGQHKFLGSYPLHFHMCDDVDGNWFRSNSIHHSLTRCVTIHGSDGAEVSDNVCYLTHGHSYFLEDSVEQRTIIDGNLGLGTQHGVILMSDMKQEWCNETMDVYCDALATFWITHPNNYIRNNVAAGSDNTGFWFSVSFFPLGPSKERQLERKTSPDMHAYHSKILEFDNNKAHSCFGRGMRLDQRISNGETDPDNNDQWVPENGVFVATTSHVPHDPPTPEGTDTTSYMYRFCAYKNRNQNVWTKAGNLILDQFTFADASRGLSMAKCGKHTYTEAKRSLFIGESDNIGYPEEPFGRSMPTQPDEALQGIEFYQGPSYVTDSYFDKYTHLYADDIFRPAGAVSHKRETPYPSQPISGTSGLKFGFCDTPDTNRAFRGYPPLKGFGNRDGNRQNNIRDFDGSLTGTPGTQLVPIHRFFMTDRCLIREPWNMAVCPYEYCRANFKGEGGAFEVNRDNYSIHLRRDDRPNDPFYLIGERGDNYLLIKNMSYTVYFNGTSPSKMPIFGMNLLPGDYFRVGLCYPTDSVFEFQSPDIKKDTPAFAVDSVEELDLDTTGRAYFWDQPRGLLFVKVVGWSERVHKEKCPGFYCPKIIVKWISGSTETPDCFEAAYGADGPYKREEDSTTPKPTIPECETTTKPEDWGAPAIPSQYPSEPFNPPCQEPPVYPATESLGCFLDDPDHRDVPHERVDRYKTMTVKFCTDRCYQRNYPYAALQNGVRCFCGNMYGGLGEKPGECTTPCAGDETEMCGGTNRNTIYATGRAVPVDDLLVCGPDNGGVIIDNSCYYLTSDPVQYADGQRACLKLGGNLATITSQTVQDAVEKYMRPKMVDAWFGLNDITQEGTMEYIDGTPVGSYTNMKDGQGTSDSEDGFAVQADSLYKWNDRMVTLTFNALCQIPLDAQVPAGETCGTDGAGMKFGSGSCYAVLNKEMSKKDAEYACLTRMGTVVDVNDQNRGEILQHIYVYGDTFDYWTAKVDADETLYELKFKELYNEVATTKSNKNAVICSLETLSASNPCSTGWQQFNDQCYLYTGRTASSFDTALILCQEGTSDILMVHSEEENDFVCQLVNQIGSVHVFIGFQYSTSLGTFEWLDGSETSYTNWRSGHGDENTANGKCGRIRTADTLWKNRDCNKGANVVCQAPAGQ